MAHADGILTSTTCMMNMPFAKFALDQAKNYPDLGVGIHLVLTVGRPLVDGAKSYTDKMVTLFVQKTIQIINPMLILKNYTQSGKLK